MPIAAESSKNKAERFQDVRPAFHAAVPDMEKPYAQKTELMFAVISRRCSQLVCQPEVMIWPWWDFNPRAAFRIICKAESSELAADSLARS